MIDVQYVNRQFVTAGLPVVSIYADGTFQLVEGATTQQIAQAQAIMDAYDPAAIEAIYEEIRQAHPIARQWFADHPAAVTFVRLTAAQRGTQIDAMSLLQLREVIKFVVEAVVFLIKRELL